MMGKERKKKKENERVAVPLRIKAWGDLAHESYFKDEIIAMHESHTHKQYRIYTHIQFAQAKQFN